MKEDIISKLIKYGAKIDPDEFNSFLTPVYIAFLKHHFDAIGINVPLLLGPYGIGKNNIVKQLAVEYGFRVVHLRLPYLSDLDFYGHEYYPSLDFFSCTDEYLEFARGMVDLLKNRLNDILEDESGDSIISFMVSNDPKTAETKKALEDLIVIFEREAKTPVLLLEEIARTDVYFRRVLQTIIDHSKFLDKKQYYAYNINECRIVATADMPVGYGKGEDEENLNVNEYYNKYILKDINQYGGFYNYFSNMRLTPKEVFTQWIAWAKDNNKGDIHPLVLGFINNDIAVAYNVKPINDAVETQNLEDLPIVHSTFWTWENLSNYLKSIDKNRIINDKIIFGLIGKEQGEEFINFLSQNNYEVKKAKDRKDEIYSTLTECFEADLPTSLFLDSENILTETVSRVEEAKKYIIERVDLSAENFMDHICLPTKNDLLDYLCGEFVNCIMEDKELVKAIESLKEKCRIPKAVVIRAPVSEFRKRIEKAKESNTPLVIIFEGYDQCSLPTAQKMILQAICEKEICGFKFQPDLLKVIVICNPSKKGDQTDHTSVDLILKTVYYQ